MKSSSIDRDEASIFSDLQALCGSSGYIHVLAFLSHRDNWVPYDGFMSGKVLENSYKHERIIRTEFSTLMGLMLQTPIDFSLPTPSDMKALTNRTYILLKELHDCLSKPMLEALGRAALAHDAGMPVDSLNPFHRGNVLREPIFYGGESAYVFQYRDLAVGRYSKDEEWLIANKGFSIKQASIIIKSLAAFQNRKIIETMKGFYDIDPSLWTILPGFTFSIEDIIKESSLAPDIVTSFIEALTVPLSPTNTKFLSLGEFNIATALPLIRDNFGNYISFQSYSLVEALYDSPFYWMAADKAYSDTAFTHRGEFTEEFVAGRMVQVFGADKVHRNVIILEKGKQVSEIDVLVIFANRAMIIQCKSKKLTLEARKGNDLQIKDDFKKAIQSAYDQAYVCSISLQNKELKFMNGDIELIIPELDEIYPICVVSDHYPALTVQAREFLNHKSTNIIHPPLVSDVFLIDVISEFLNTPLRFLSYVNRRTHFHQQVHSTNELTIFAYHLRQNLWIDSDINMMMVDDGISVDLDAAITVRREGLRGVRTPEGILTHLQGTLLGELLAGIENRAEATLVDLGFMLLTLNGETLDNLNRGLEEISKQTAKDGQHHDFTLGFDESGSGLTVHCNLLSNLQAAEKLTAHCQRRKYFHRANKWFGLSVNTTDGLPRFGINFIFPWKQDDEMDNKTKGMSKEGLSKLRRGAFRRKKPGRNDLCLCGSGKKFKKCCLN